MLCNDRGRDRTKTDRKESARIEKAAKIGGTLYFLLRVVNFSGTDDQKDKTRCDISLGKSIYLLYVLLYVSHTVLSSFFYHDSVRG